jgi:hypothetical protein
MDIPEIKLKNINFREITVQNIEIPDWVREYPTSIPLSAPITVQIGLPIVNIPGCVEAHEQNSNRERSGVISQDDPKGVKTYCDAGIPSFNPIQYEPENLVPTRKDKFSGVDTRDKTSKEETEQTSEVPKAEGAPVIPPSTASIQCPTQEQLSKEPVGFLFDSGRKEILGYKLVGDQCIREVGDVPIITQVLNGLPPTGVVITTGGIAVVATTSALLAKPFADILLKVIKPTVKKVLKKVASIRGKTPKVDSVAERRAEQRLRNDAIQKLKSVMAKSQKKK